MEQSLQWYRILFEKSNYQAPLQLQYSLIEAVFIGTTFVMLLYDSQFFVYLVKLFLSELQGNTMKDFEQIAHTADLQIRVYGATQNELFRHALQGMFQVIGPSTNDCVVKNDRLVCAKLDKKHEIEVTAQDLHSLLVNFLSEALYLSDVHNEAYLDCTIHSLTQTTIKATLAGVAVTRFNLEIKAVTYHDLQIQQNDDQWQADIVFDI